MCQRQSPSIPAEISQSPLRARQDLQYIAGANLCCRPLADMASELPAAPSPKLLLVEDDQVLSAMLASCLENAGYDVVCCTTVENMLHILSSRPLDVVVLDVGLPDGNGLHALAQQRAPAAPVICITANPAIDVRIEALAGVAVDILVKPFDERELILRVRNALRATPTKPAQVVRLDGFSFDLATGALATADGDPVALTTMEHRMLFAFARNPNRALSRQWMLAAVFERSHAADGRIIDVTVGRLRKKLGSRGHSIVRSVRHVGYLLAAEELTEN